MTVTLNHMIVPALDHHEEATFLAAVLGLECLPPAGARGHLIPVKVNDGLTLEFMTVDIPVGVHLAFDVDPDTFDRVLDRLRELGVPYGNRPWSPDNGLIDHPLCPRGLFFTDRTGNLYEIMSPR